MKALTSLAAALALALPAMTVQANDIAGIKLGMSLAEAKSSLASSVGGLKIGNFVDGKIETGIYGEKGKKMLNEGEGVIAYKGDADGIWVVGRYQFIPVNQRFTIQTLVESLRKKFGKESSAEIPNGKEYGQWGNMIWIYGDNEKLLFQKIGQGSLICHTYNPGGLETPSGFVVDIPRVIPSDCNKTYNASWFVDENGLVKNLSVNIIDYSLIRKAIERREAQEKAEKEQKVRNQSGVKPSL